MISINALCIQTPDFQSAQKSEDFAGPSADIGISTRRIDSQDPVGLFSSTPTPLEVESFMKRLAEKIHDFNTAIRRCLGVFDPQAVERRLCLTPECVEVESFMKRLSDKINDLNMVIHRFLESLELLVQLSLALFAAREMLWAPQ